MYILNHLFKIKGTFQKIIFFIDIYNKFCIRNTKFKIELYYILILI